MHQNADDCIHQPDQRREGDDSGIIQWLIRLQWREVVRRTRFLFSLESYRFVIRRGRDDEFLEARIDEQDMRDFQLDFLFNGHKAQGSRATRESPIGTRTSSTTRQHELHRSG